MNRIATLLSFLLCFPLMDTTTAFGDPIEQESESGPVKVKLSLDNDKPLIGDVVTLFVEVVAEENVEVLMPEFGEALESFAIVDFVPRESIDDQGRTVATQKYRLEPPSSGKQAIPPILIEYVDHRDGQQESPEGFDAYEIMTERVDFEVQSVAPKNASNELKPPLGKIDPPVPPGPPVWPWIIGGLILATAGAFLAVRIMIEARRRSRRKTAYQVASWRLEQLLREPRISQQELDQFYVRLSDIVRTYLEDRFELRAPELTTEEFLTSLRDSPDMSIEHQGLLREFLRQADLVKFARAEPTESDTQAAIDAASRFLEETRENAPLMDVDEEGRAIPSAKEVQYG